MVFDMKLLFIARANFSTVYVDRYGEDGKIYGSETATEGDRIRIYATDWE